MKKPGKSRDDRFLQKKMNQNIGSWSEKPGKEGKRRRAEAEE